MGKLHEEVLRVIYSHKLIVLARQNCFKAKNGRNKEFIVDWENGTWVACNNSASRVGNIAQLYLRNG